VFHVTPPGLPLFLTLRKGDELPEKYQTLKKFLPKQMENSDQTSQFISALESSKNIMLIGMAFAFLINIFALGSLEYLVALIRCLQIMLNLPIYRVVFPA
jgi:hypothetical protein